MGDQAGALCGGDDDHRPRGAESGAGRARAEAAINADLGFHEALVASAGSTRLSQAYAPLLDVLRLYLTVLSTRDEHVDAKQIMDEHRVIAAAFAAGDRARLARPVDRSASPWGIALDDKGAARSLWPPLVHDRGVVVHDRAAMLDWTLRILGLGGTCRDDRPPESAPGPARGLAQRLGIETDSLLANDLALPAYPPEGRLDGARAGRLAEVRVAA